MHNLSPGFTMSTASVRGPLYVEPWLGQAFPTTNPQAPFHLHPRDRLARRLPRPRHPEELLVRVDEPAPGLAHFFAMPMGDQVLLSIRFYLYGQQATAVATQVEADWQAWIGQLFPADGASQGA